MSRKKQNDELQGRCRGLTKAGTPCRAFPTEGGLCFLHANPAKAAELGRIGGRRNRHAVVDEVPQLPRLDNVVAVRDALAQMIADLHTKKLHPRAVAGLAQLFNALMRAMEGAELEARIRRLEDVASALRDSGKDASKP